VEIIGLFPAFVNLFLRKTKEYIFIVSNEQRKAVAFDMKMWYNKSDL